MSTNSTARASPLLCGAYEPPCLKPWHGCSFSFTSAIPAFYQDNSFQKTIRLQRKVRKTRLDLVKKHLVAKARIERVKVQQELVAIAHQEDLAKRRIDVQVRLTAATLHRAAVLIQKTVRGWLCRLRIEKELISHGRTSTLAQVNSLAEFTHWWYLETEEEAAEKAKVLQRAYRRYRRLKMLAVLAKAYAIVRERDEAASAVAISSVFRSFLASRQFRWVVIQETRDAALLRIKRRLACLTIGILWRRAGLSVKLVRVRIRRYVRKLRARRKGTKGVGAKRASFPNECESPAGTLSSFASPKGFSAYASLEDVADPHNRSSIYSSMRSSSPHYEERAKTPVSVKMNALGFYPPKDVLLAPVLERRRLESPAFGGTTPEGVFTRLLATTESSNQHSTSQPHRPDYSHRRTTTTPLQRSRLSSTGTPDLRSRRRYMDATESFANASRAEEEEEPHRRRLRGQWHPTGNVFGLTVSWTRKRRTKSRQQSTKRSWRPFFATSDPEYILSLDNATYRPKQFTALPYRREELARPQTSAAEQRLPERTLEDSGVHVSLRVSRNLTPMLYSGGDMPTIEHFNAF